MARALREIPIVYGLRVLLQNGVILYDKSWYLYTLIHNEHSRLDGDLQGTAAAHLVQCLLIILELEDIGDLIHRLRKRVL